MINIFHKVDYNENEEQHFLDILSAIETNLSIEQARIEVPFDTDFDIEAGQAGIIHRACSPKRGMFR